MLTSPIFLVVCGFLGWAHRNNTPRGRACSDKLLCGLRTSELLARDTKGTGAEHVCLSASGLILCSLGTDRPLRASLHPEVLRAAQPIITPTPAPTTPHHSRSLLQTWTLACGAQVQPWGGAGSPKSSVPALSHLRGS